VSACRLIDSDSGESERVVGGEVKGKRDRREIENLRGVERLFIASEKLSSLCEAGRLTKYWTDGSSLIVELISSRVISS